MCASSDIISNKSSAVLAQLVKFFICECEELDETIDFLNASYSIHNSTVLSAEIKA